MDNDSDDNDNENNEMNLTGFLFGNIDFNGKLEADFLDEDARKNLSSLARLGLNSLLSDVISDGETRGERNDDKSGNSSSSSDDGPFRRKSYDNDGSDSPDYERKHETAVDYSDINELAEESLNDPTENNPQKVKDDPDSAAAGKETNGSTDDGTEIKKDEDLMPPPSLPVRSLSQDSKTASEDSGVSEGESDKPKVERKLDTPLAAMLPSKYANVDVRDLFPDFRPDKVLRFSRLFGPGKLSSLPQIWRSVRRRRRKQLMKEKDMKYKDGSDSTSDTDEPRRRSGFNPVFAPIPPKDQWASDDEDKLLKETQDEEKDGVKPETNSSGDAKPKVADWRFGPAQIWYDMLDVPETGEGFNYGFKVRDRPGFEKTTHFSDEPKKPEHDPIPDDAFLMVSQLHWEDDVVWDGNDIKHKVLQKLNSKTNAAGWLPSSGSRTAGAFSQPGKSTPSTGAVPGTKLGGIQNSSGKMSKSQLLLAKISEETDDTWYSIFPVENEELVYSKWEEEVIWDAEAVTKVPKPKVLTLDPNDENIILGIPDDIDPSKILQNLGPVPKVKIPHPHVKKSKILLGKAGVINVLQEDTPPPPPKSPDRDPFNISNDVYYMAKSSEATLRLKVGGGNLIQHSTPVVELRAPFIPTHMGPMKLRMFHRPAMKKYSHGSLASISSQPVLPLLKQIKKKLRQRELERIASGGGDVFFMRSPDDLTGRDGEIILVEFCEENPPLMNQVGMCSKIKNYYKRKASKDVGPPEFKYGEIAYAHTSPFLGILYPGQCSQVVENNMYRAPIYPHNIPFSDFLVIRTRNNYYIREANALFTAGQECPLYEVPGPNSKRANNFVRDFLQVFIYRLFWKSRDNPRKIRMDDIKKAFPAHSESSIRKRLKQCADFKRTGMDSNFWVIKPDFRLPSEEEIRSMVSPEQCCAYFSMIAAEQRLKDAGYGEKFIFAQQEDDDEEMQLKMDDEIKVAPWNTTRAYIQAMKGKCILQLTGPADPTGCGEGFSYVRMPNKPVQNKEEQESQPKRTVTGTDADLRRLSLNNAKALLRKFGVPEEEIKKLSRWEVIDVVRTLSTEKAKAGEEGMDKFSRGNRFSIAEHQERYKEECQRIFDIQNRVLSSAEVLSTDEGESTASEESDMEELGKNLENMLANKKTSTQMLLEREEQERRELMQKIMEDREGGNSKSSKNKKDEDLQQSNQSPTSRILKITRTFKDQEGKEYTRVETVRRTPVIDAYIKIRTTKDEAFIRQFATLDEAQKEEMKREKRRIQEQLRRIKRNQEKIGLLQQQQQLGIQPEKLSPGTPISIGDRGRDKDRDRDRDRDFDSYRDRQQPSTPSSSHHKEHHHKDGHSPTSSRRKPKLKPDLKLKCGACGQVGHMRTNKACPLYTGTLPTPSVQVALTEEQEEQIEKELNFEDEEDLVNVEGTKVKLSNKLLKRHEEVKRRALLVKVPKDAMKNKKRRLAGDGKDDYTKRYNKPANRRRTDPVVVLSSMLEQILNEMRDLPDVQPFVFPVNAKKVHDYHGIIQRPMDLQSIRENLRQKRYQSREEFLADVNQIVENSSLYNGPKSSLTVAAQRMLQKCVDRLAEKEDRLMRLEKCINPLLDDDDQVALSFIFEKLINGRLKMCPESWPFLKPVDKKKVKDYYTVIRRPMDLETVTKKVAAHKYHSRSEFLSDINLIVANCRQYNGMESTFTKQAEGLYEFTKKALDELGDHVSHLENNITLVQEKARNDAELDDTWAEYEGYAGEHSRHGDGRSSPENDFVDIEGDRHIDRHIGAPSTSLQKAPPIIPALPEVKRSRGRPRKLNTTVEDVKDWSMKRGRGRPRKDSFSYNPNFNNNLLNNTHYPNFDEDLQFSTDDEEFEEVQSDSEGVAITLDQGERLLKPKQEEDGSQQAAEAMVQLSGAIGFYTQPQEETMDIDPNYDPSDFLGKLPKREPNVPTFDDQQQMQQQQQYIYEEQKQLQTMEQQMMQQQQYQQQYQPPPPPQQQQQQQFMYDQQQIMQQQDQYQQYDTQYQQPSQPQPDYDPGNQLLQQYQQHVDQQQRLQEQQQQQLGSNEGLDNGNVGIHDDLAVSDSDEEQNNLKMDIFKEEHTEEHDGEGLWF